MDVALYHPEHGYYRRKDKVPIGRSGDFTTAPLVSQLPAIAIVNWLERLRTHGRKHRNIIEVGAGDASLATAIYDALGWAGRRRYCYHLVESSAALRSKQQQSKYANKFTWHDTMPDAINHAPQAIVIHNELVDAFPCQVLEFYMDRWQEVSLTVAADGTVTQTLQEPDFQVPAIWQFSALNWQPDDGQRVEVHASYLDWLEQWVPAAESLDMLTIDYGGDFPQMYERRPHGTLRAYFHHMLMSGNEAYERPGYQDITADVNFTDIVNNGKLLGLHAERHLSLADFLREQAPHKVKSQTDYRLLDPHDAGQQFRVLHQWK